MFPHDNENIHNSVGKHSQWQRNITNLYKMSRGARYFVKHIYLLSCQETDITLIPLSCLCGQFDATASN